MNALHVATLILVSQLRQRFARLRAKREVGSHITYSWEWEECDGMNLHTPREFHFGSWSLSGFSNLHKAIVEVKTQWLNKFFRSLESSWNLNV
jgi:hypothetical protein